MSNTKKYAVVLAKLNEIMASSNGYDSVTDSDSSRSWQNTQLLLRMTDDGLTAYLKGQAVYEVLDDDDLSLLQENDMLVSNGAPLRVKLNGKEAKAVGIRFALLKEKAADEEQAANELLKFRTENNRLRQELKAAQEQNMADAAVASFYTALADKVSSLKTPEIIVSQRPIAKSVKALGGVPVLFCSDWHWDEVVNPGEVMAYNEYNRDIAHQRANRIFDKTVEILTSHMAGVHYDAFVCALGGDMVSGNIHEDLRETNEAYVTESICDLASLLAPKFRMLANEFPELLVPCVSGNHGRLSQKWRAKGKQQNSFDYMLYNTLRLMLQDVENITFVIPESTDIIFNTYHVRYLLTHGDQFRPQGNESIQSAIKRGDLQKRKLHQMNGGYDYLILGHFHSYGIDEGIIRNGSLKGMDEHSFQHNREYEPARQALWIAHPDFGVGSHRAIFGDDPIPDGVDYPAVGVPELSKIDRRFV